ncbi:UDP-N-acetylglucosamine diphosphorylase [Candidatus Avoscillospira sp. LCP25S3_F1]|uniref:UDP-N-acetylglucosamine diphosphorylase n=1 Tax=Candidatus Avoscillospira sp. LCP25S3_F1 TaxID=3438825 RepID=UPI003F8E5289
MAGTSAVIFVPDDTNKTGYGRPLMLSRIMGSPLLSWLVSALIARGAGRFFLVCHEQWATEARACFPAGVDLMVAGSADAADLLHVFLSTAEDEDRETVVVTGPAVFVSTRLTAQANVIPAPSCVYHVDREALMDALDEKFSFLEFLRQRGKAYADRDGVYSIRSGEELAAWQPTLNLQHLHDLIRGGVEIWDYQNCYVDPTVRVGKGTVLMPGTILRGGTVIGENCVIGPNALLENTIIGDRTTVNSSQLYDAHVGSDTTVGPFAYIRPNSHIGDHVRLGDFVEVKNSTIGDGTKVSHLTYVGDSDVGRNVNFGCGTVTVNYDRAKKSRTTIEDDAFIGCNTNLVAPVTVGRGAYTGAGSTITDNVPSGALAVARARQTNKREWANRHKLKESK